MWGKHTDSREVRTKSNCCGRLKAVEDQMSRPGSSENDASGVRFFVFWHRAQERKPFLLPLSRLVPYLLAFLQAAALFESAGNIGSILEGRRILPCAKMQHSCSGPHAISFCPAGPSELMARPRHLLFVGAGRRV